MIYAMANAPDDIRKLVERFEEQLESYKNGSYNETQLRREFLDPFFEALGWDVHNKLGYSEKYKEVVHEDSIATEDGTKAPDYCFRVGEVRKFFVEAKKPSVNVKDDISPAFQLRRYAWSAKLPLSILTDFEEFAVYDCRVKPVKTDKASQARVLYLTFRDYIEKWDEIQSFFSRDAVLRGAFDRYCESKRHKKGTAEVDDAFLLEIESWREMLARSIALRNSSLTERELNFAVQATIDRIVFLRICEDRAIEDYGKLRSLINGPRIYPRMLEYFNRADERYNSGLFHFEMEKGRPARPDEITQNLEIDDKPLKEILKHLYYPESPYVFSEIPSDILGQVYERFLGKVISLTKGHQARIEEKPEVRKAGGVYYTPTYIVDYIVENTLGKLLEKSDPKKASKLRVLDPACGSGSFLLGAYEYLLKWHLDWYVKDGPEKWAKGKNPSVYQAGENDWRLTSREKKKILLDNIYGVDIDTQAVEVTKLSLLLKVLEGETEQSINAELRLFKSRALPDLDANIKCGNSLVGTDFYKGKNLSLLDDEERFKVNAFDWDAEFPDIMKSGGFDCVIGNPPYVRQEGLGDFKDYFKGRYEVYDSSADLYTYFIERGVSLLSKGGIFGYIVANKWMRANYGKRLREWLKSRQIIEITDFGDLPVFKKATTYPCILLIKSDGPAREFRATNVKTLEFEGLSSYVKENSFLINPSSLDPAGWALVNERAGHLLEKLRQTGVPLGEYVKGKIYYGIKTGLNEAFVIDEETKNRLIKEDPKSKEIIKPFLLGREIKRYAALKPENYLILFPRGFTRKNMGKEKDAWKWLSRNYSSIANHLAGFKDKAEKRCDQGEFWWELRACDYYPEFGKKKICWGNLCKYTPFTYENNSSYINAPACFFITDDKYILGILNSKIIWHILDEMAAGRQGGYIEAKPMYVSKLPIRTIDFKNKDDKRMHDEMVRLVEEMLSLNEKLAVSKAPHEKENLERQIKSTDRAIDELVYKLYGLTPEEIEIVEGK